MLDQADGINPLFAEASLTSAEQPIPFAVISKGRLTIAVVVILRKGTPANIPSQLDAVQIVRDARDIWKPPLKIAGSFADITPTPRSLMILRHLTLLPALEHFRMLGSAQCSLPGLFVGILQKPHRL